MKDKVSIVNAWKKKTLLVGDLLLSKVKLPSFAFSYKYELMNFFRKKDNNLLQGFIKLKGQHFCSCVSSKISQCFAYSFFFEISKLVLISF